MYRLRPVNLLTTAALVSTLLGAAILPPAFAQPVNGRGPRKGGKAVSTSEILRERSMRDYDVFASPRTMEYGLTPGERERLLLMLLVVGRQRAPQTQ